MNQQDRHFALIDTNSGCIWWVGSAKSPEEACQQAHKETGNIHTKFRWVFECRGNGYFVFETVAGFEVDDGQSEEAIAAVEVMPYLGLYAPIDA